MAFFMNIIGQIKGYWQLASGKNDFDQRWCKMKITCFARS